jgi:hypothetical protein
MDITHDYYLRMIYSDPTKKHWRTRNAIRFLNQEISDLRLNALNRVGGQYCQFLMNREANYLDKQLREVLN